VSTQCNTPLEPAPSEAELLYKWRLLWSQRDKPRDERLDLQAYVDGQKRPVIRLLKQVPLERGR